MIENILTKRKASLFLKLTIKSAVSVGVCVIAIALPVLVHGAVGQTGGVTLLPIYFPILIGGCLLGAKWGLATAVIAPILSFVLTSAFGTAMPSLSRLPFMIAELSALALSSGFFSKKITENGLVAIPAAVFSIFFARAVFLLLALSFGRFCDITFDIAFSLVQAGIVGILLWMVVAPLVVMGLKRLLAGEKA